jgi:hypothetical protein
MQKRGRYVREDKAEDTVMKMPRKVIEKISLPLMFVTFVMAALVFAVTPVSAAPNQCAEVFCNQDGDDFFRDHKKCPDACGGSIDCDDNNALVPVPDECPGGTVSTLYTAELLSGAFIFDSVNGNQDRIVSPGGSRDSLLEGEEDAQMSRPGDGDPGQATWDDVFATGCPQLVPAGGQVSGFVSSRDNWTWAKHDDRRLVLRNIHLWDIYGDEWEIRVQLLGKVDDPDVPDFLPTTGSVETTLISGRVDGRTVSGGPGGRKSCRTDENTKDKSCENKSSNELMEGFCLKNDIWSVMKISILPSP